MPMLDAVFSHYEYVKGRIIAINPARKVRGQLTAQDWPPPDIVDEAFYMLTLGESPIGRQMFSPLIPTVVHEIQWKWIVKGKDIAAGQVGPNRGVRFQTNYAMKDEMRQAMSPYFCQKFIWGYDNPGAPGAHWVGVPTNPIEFIGWAPPVYHETIDKDTGVVYGTVAVRVWDMTDPITA